jgi:hypothetical protein
VVHLRIGHSLGIFIRCFLQQRDSESDRTSWFYLDLHSQFSLLWLAILSKLEDYVIPDGVFRGFIRPLEFLHSLPSVWRTHPNTLTLAHLIPVT